MSKVTLQNWLNTNGLILDQEDLEFVSEIMNTEGVVIECDDSATDWELWCGDGVMIETNPTGTRVVQSGSYTVTTKPGHYDLREKSNGMTPEEVSEYVAGLDFPIYAVR